MTKLPSSHLPDLSEQGTIPPVAKSSVDQAIGTNINNFRIVKMIGKGGFGAVYQAEHVALGTFAAIKILWPHFQNNQELLERFFREAQSVARIDHPHIVRVMDFGHLPQQGHYIVMDYLDGQTPSRAMKKDGLFTFPRIIRLYKQLCSALHLIHSKGIIHRDLKPANIFLIRSQEEPGQENVKLLDFGIAALASKRSITLTGTSIGSPRYMSPEQASGHSAEVDARSDLYSIAIILFKLLTGDTPYTNEGYGGIILQHLQAPVPHLMDRKPDYYLQKKRTKVISQVTKVRLQVAKAKSLVDIHPRKKMSSRSILIWSAVGLTVVTGGISAIIFGVSQGDVVLYQKNLEQDPATSRQHYTQATVLQTTSVILLGVGILSAISVGILLATKPAKPTKPNEQSFQAPRSTIPVPQKVHAPILHQE